MRQNIKRLRLVEYVDKLRLNDLLVVNIKLSAEWQSQNSRDTDMSVQPHHGVVQLS